MNNDIFENGFVRTACKVLFAGALALALSGCAAGADPKAMIVTPLAAEKPFPQILQRAMCVRDVTGGEKTNPMWVSKVDNPQFKTALTSSLDTAGLLSPSECRYSVDANLLGLEQPTIGFDMTVTSHVNYKVYTAAGEPYLLETIDTPFTATVGDAFIGAERLKKANEGSIRENIRTFLGKLRDK